jgi:hypothetical protein
MPRLEVEVTTEEMTNLREVQRCVRVHGCDDERSAARGPEVVATECEVWWFRYLCNTILLESVY